MLPYANGAVALRDSKKMKKTGKNLEKGAACFLLSWYNIVAKQKHSESEDIIPQ